MRTHSSFVAAYALAALTLALPAESADRTTAPGKTAAPAVLQQGKAIFDQWCLGCHGPLPGMGMFPPAGSYRLQERYKGTVPAVLEDRSDLTADFIRTVVRQGMAIMPPTRKTEVTDSGLDAVIAYLTQRKRT